MKKLPIDIGVKIKADATKPLQDFSTTIVNASNFIGKVLGAPIEGMGGIVSDQIQVWRAKNIERLRNNWLARRMERGVSPEAIKCLPFDIGVRLIEAASQEDHEDAQDLWAELLDKATDPNSSINVRRVHIDILKSISAVEISILRLLWLKKEIYEKDPGSLPNPEINSFWKKYLVRFSPEERALAIQNLKRQQCVRLAPDKFLFAGVSEIDEVLAHGKNVEKERLKAVIHSLRQLVEYLSGMHDKDLLGISDETRGRHFAIPEVFFELTELGIDLMNLCASARDKRNA